MLTISPEKVCFIIVKAREYDEKVEPTDENSGSNPGDDMGVDILEDLPDDPTLEELTGAIEALNDDEALELLALSWVGRGDYDVEEWSEALTAAGDVRDKHIADYLTGMPLVGDYLEEGLSKFGHSCQEFEMGRM